MLIIVNRFSQLEFSQIAEVYEESLTRRTIEEFSDYGRQQGFLQAKADYFHYLKSFLMDDRAFCAVWAPDGRYIAALRIEPYLDGLLLAGLETAPMARRRGYAAALVASVVDYLRQSGPCILYSHIDKKNVTSLNLHRNCGFTKMLDHAAFIDGSVSHNSCTMRLIIKG